MVRHRLEHAGVGLYSKGKYCLWILKFFIVKQYKVDIFVDKNSNCIALNLIDTHFIYYINSKLIKIYLPLVSSQKNSDATELE